MKLAELELHGLRIPFRGAFKHASAERTETESVWVEARSAAGHVGYGESCPRAYVTGEDQASVRDFFSRQHESLLRIGDLVALRSWMAENADELDRAPAAWCAVELALLDLLSKEQGHSVEAALGLPELSGEFSYTAVIGDGELASFRLQLDRYIAFGFRDFKVKLSGEIERDREKLAEFRRLAVEELRVRADANNLWDCADEAAEYLDALDHPLFGIEEPLQPDDYPGLAALAGCGTRIILDESLRRAEQVQRIQG
ncbi:MAG: enolase C-terminal domain-like protein, partial [Myxococcota bacterium]